MPRDYTHALTSPPDPPHQPPSRTVYVHRGVTEYLEASASPSVCQHVRRHLQHLSVFGLTGCRSKGVRGLNSGWRRAPAGGPGGRQWYLWWAPYDAPPAERLGMERGSVVVRAVRHHDDTPKALSDDRLSSDYDAKSPHDLAYTDEEHSAFTRQQIDHAKLSARVRVIQGLPGTGKTITLQEAARWLDSDRMLYVTRNEGLVQVAERIFDTSRPDTVDVRTFDELVEELSGHPTTSWRLHDWRSAVADVPYHESLGLWDKVRSTLLPDELYAHAVGRCLPFDFRDVPAHSGIALTRDAYFDARKGDVGDGRNSGIGEVAAREAAKLVDWMEGEEERWTLCFPALAASRRALDVLRDDAGLPDSFPRYGGILLDELQDLTPLEYAVVLQLARRLGERTGCDPAVVVAGDEAQVVRPSAFDWGEFHAMVSDLLGSDPESLSLREALRSPKDIATVVNNSGGLYNQFPKPLRPKGDASAALPDDMEEETPSVDGGPTGELGEPRSKETEPPQIFRVVCTSLEELNDLLRQVLDIPDSVVVVPGYEQPAFVRQLDSVAPSEFLLPEEVKGREFQTVVVLGAAGHLREIEEVAKEQLASQSGPYGAWGKLLIDRLRVCVSRATGTLAFLDYVTPGGPGEGTSSALVARMDGELLKGIETVRVLDPEYLPAELRALDNDDSDLAARYAEDARSELAAGNFERALARAKRAVEELRSSDDPADVADESRRREVFEIATSASIQAGLSARASGQTPGLSLLAACREHFLAAHEPATAEAIAAVAAYLMSAQDERLDAADSIGRALDALPRTDGAVVRDLGAAVESWLKEVQVEELTRAGRVRVLDNLYHAAKSEFGADPGVGNRVKTLLEDAVGGQIAAGLMDSAADVRKAREDADRASGERESDLRRRIQEQQENIADLTADRETLRRQNTDYLEQLTGPNQDAKRVQNENDTLRDENNGLNDRIHDLEGRRGQLESEVRTQATRAERAEAELDAARETVTEEVRAAREEAPADAAKREEWPQSKRIGRPRDAASDLRMFALGYKSLSNTNEAVPSRQQGVDTNTQADSPQSAGGTQASHATALGAEASLDGDALHKEGDEPRDTDTDGAATVEDLRTEPLTDRERADVLQQDVITLTGRVSAADERQRKTDAELDSQKRWNRTLTEQIRKTGAEHRRREAQLATRDQVVEPSGDQSGCLSLVLLIVVVAVGTVLAHLA